jgi:distribution and morphology protein 12
MSIELNWETLTAGPDGQELAERIRDFIHTKFQSVPLPRFIKSVTVHEFQFGSVPPELELKDITDPLPDFYEENPDAEDSDSSPSENGNGDANNDEFHVPDELKAAAERRRRAAEAGGGGYGAGHPPSHIHIPGRRGPPLLDLGHQIRSPSPSPFLGVLTPGIPGGTTNMHYFHSQFASGTQTPLLAAAAAHGHLFGEVHHSASSPELYHAGQAAQRRQGGGDGMGRGHGRHPSWGSILSVGDEFAGEGSAGAVPLLREKHSVSTLAPTSAGTSRPPTRDAGGEEDGRESTQGLGMDEEGREKEERKARFREPRIEDMQAVFRIRYAGDVRLLLTADILLDYPMPSFVGIPVRLSITGLTFDGVGVLAYIRKRAHFCFLSPEDAVAAVGGEENKEEVEGERHHGGGGGGLRSAKMGGLLQEIRVESEIGQREGGKQSLKNVGKVERFVLEQVRRIFEEEFVYPSFWTFLV